MKFTDIQDSVHSLHVFYTSVEHQYFRTSAVTTTSETALTPSELLNQRECKMVDEDSNRVLWPYITLILWSRPVHVHAYLASDRVLLPYPRSKERGNRNRNRKGMVILDNIRNYSYMSRGDATNACACVKYDVTNCTYKYIYYIIFAHKCIYFIIFSLISLHFTSRVTE